MTLFKISKVDYHGLICDNFYILYSSQRLIVLHDWHQFVTKVVVCVSFKSQSNTFTAGCLHASLSLLAKSSWLNIVIKAFLLENQTLLLNICKKI
jgi:hypothetical protein